MVKKILSIIPARGGSKGLSRKNIINLAGKPLIAWTIEASLNSKYITKTVVSSDDKEILDISLGCGSEIIKRPDSLAIDSATSESVVRHAIDYLESTGEMFDIIILLQPTSPLRSFKDIDSAFEVMFDSAATAVISTCEFNSKTLKTLIENSNGFLEGVSNNKYPFMRRQDLPKVYMPNGSIYIINTKSFLAENSFITSKTANYIASKKSSVDIDTLADLNIAESILME
ncbi:MAG: acylneuraminate cytidylyltransferase family protein [Gammaproteobacteria bacterium]|nr:acylneuraminate cytidylyltransferase family protein [Gammaproteobacteria bacterium]